MFEANFKSADVMKKVVDAIKEVLDHATFDCSKYGIRLQGISKSHTSLVILTLFAGEILKIRCDRNLLMRMNLVNVAKVFKNADNKDSLMVTAQDDPDTVAFVLESQNHAQICKYKINLMSLDDEHSDLNIPDIDYACNLHLPSKEFARICHDLSKFGEQMVIECTNNGVEFSASSYEDSASVKLTQKLAVDKEEEAVIIDVKEPVKLTYSIKCLNLFTKATPLSSQVKLSMMADHPMKVEYEIPNLGYIQYFLAGFIEG